MNVKEVMRTYNLRAKKSLGQNFLIDGNIREKICGALSLTDTDRVVEIGAGCGALTSNILEKTKNVIAVERDARLCAVLRNELGADIPPLQIICDDILQVDLSNLADSDDLIVVGNLPYYITTKILFHLVRHRSVIRTAVVMMQKEVGDRILAKEGGKDYGRLTVGLRYFAEVKKLFEVQKNSFYPVPDVTSVVLQLTFYQKEAVPAYDDMFLAVVEALFQERRKTIHNGLCLLKSRVVDKAISLKILTACNIDPQKRAEQLTMDEFCAIARQLYEYER